MPAPVLETPVVVPVPVALAAPVVSSGRTALASTAAPMPAAAFAVAVAPTAPVLPARHPRRRWRLLSVHHQATPWCKTKNAFT